LLLKIATAFTAPLQLRFPLKKTFSTEDLVMR